MSYKNLLRFLVIPAVTGSMSMTLLMAVSVEAAERAGTTLLDSMESQTSCDVPTPSNQRSSLLHSGRQGVLVASAVGLPSDDFSADFSEAESDAAVQLFGCDCPACLRSLKQLQRQSLTQKVLGNTSQGHCWATLQRRNSPEKVQEVLMNLDAES